MLLVSRDWNAKVRNTKEENIIVLYSLGDQNEAGKWHTNLCHFSDFSFHYYCSLPIFINMDIIRWSAVHTNQLTVLLVRSRRTRNSKDLAMGWLWNRSWITHVQVPVQSEAKDYCDLEHRSPFLRNIKNSSEVLILVTWNQTKCGWKSMRRLWRWRNRTKQIGCQNNWWKLPKRDKNLEPRKINLTKNFRDMLEETRKSIIMVPVKTLKMEITWKTKL